MLSVALYVKDYSLTVFCLTLATLSVVGGFPGSDHRSATASQPLKFQNDTSRLAAAPTGLEDLLAGTLVRAPRPRATPKPPDPAFDSSLVTDVSAPLGSTAFLHCKVRHLGGRPVSWVRRRDWHILTSGSVTYTNDDRFQVVPSRNADEWSLQIKYVQKRDNGTYVCQVATNSGIISHYFNLVVQVPKAFILGKGDYHIGEGSTISLVCIIENSPVAPQYVFWQHNERALSLEGAPGVSIVTEPGVRTHSRLAVAHATRHHSGNYSCSAPGTEPAFVNVFVSEGDNTAAIQRQQGSAPMPDIPLVLNSALVLFATFWGSR